MSARTRKDWILWGALGCALVATAHAEYTLAIEAHFNKYVALAVPGALDLYVIRALQERRDVFVAVLAMVAANVASHLIVAGVLPVGWPVVSAVGAVAPLVVWRVYSLKYTRTRQELLWGLEAGAVSAPALEDEYPAPAEVLVAGQGLECAPHRAGPVLEPAPDPMAVTCAAHSLGECDECADKYGAPDRIPEWMADEYPPSTPHSKMSAVPYLVPVPDLPLEYVPSAVHSEVECVLIASDWGYLEDAQAYVKENEPATVKGLRRKLKIGQERAERLLAHLGVRP